MHTLTSLAALALLPLPVAAQQPDPFSGKWSGTVSSNNAAEMTLDVTLAGAAGTYRVSGHGTQARNNPCLGKNFPVEVTSQTKGEVKSDVKKSSLINGCPDQSITLHSAGGNLLEGATADGRAIKLSR